MTIALCLLLAVSASALSYPVYTTGDFRVYGDTQLDGALALGDDVTLTGDLAVSGAISAANLSASADFSVADSLYVGGNAVFADSVYVTSNATFADSVDMASALTVQGELHGARETIASGYGGSNKTTDMNLPFGGAYSDGTASLGLPMQRDGSIIGATYMTSLDSYTPVATGEFEVWINGSVVYSITKTFDATGNQSWTGTQARGTTTFSAGDIMSLRFDLTGTAQWDQAFYSIEVQYDD